MIKRKINDYEIRKQTGEPSSLYSQIIQNNQMDNKKFIDSYIRDDLDEIEENDVGEKKRLAFLDFMIEASRMQGNNLSDKEIRDEVNTIMFEVCEKTLIIGLWERFFLGLGP